jgi:hypothetical protein
VAVLEAAGLVSRLAQPLASSARPRLMTACTRRPRCTGKIVAFPLPTKTNLSGHFTTYVEFGQAGRYPLRVLDPNSGVKSKTIVLVIKA